MKLSTFLLDNSESVSWISDLFLSIATASQLLPCNYCKAKKLRSSELYVLFLKKILTTKTKQGDSEFDETKHIKIFQFIVLVAPVLIYFIMLIL